MRKAFILFIFLAGFLAVFSQEPPPVNAALSPICFKFAPTGSCTLYVDSVFIESNPAGTHYQFVRHIVSAHDPDMEDTSAIIAMSWYYFTGALDGDIFEYKVRAIFEDDTSEWSPPITIMHDLEDPHPVPFVDASWFSSGEYVQLIWQRTTDDASGVRGYKIYRSTNPADLVAIYESTPPMDFVASTGAEMYCYYDYTVEEGNYYYYVVVPFDSAGYSCRGEGHFPSYENIIEQVHTVGPDPLMCAILEPIPRFIQSPSCVVNIDIDHCTPLCGISYQYRLINLTTGDTTVSDWTPLPSYGWAPLEDCGHYIFSSRARTDYDTTSWYDSGEKICDLYGPQCVDSISIEQDISGGLDVAFFVGDESTFDCGAGLLLYRLYRIHIDSLDEFFPIDTGDYSHLLYEYVPDIYITDAEYRYCDDCDSDPDIDLNDGDVYAYIVVAFDSLHHWSYCASSNWDTASVDKGVVPPMLLPLSTYTPCSTANCVTLQIVDTSQGDISQIKIEQARNNFFTEGFALYGPYDVDDPVFTHTGGLWDTLTITLCGLDGLGLEEAQYYFRAIAYDDMDNISDPSNVVNTTFDCTPPNPTNVDSMHSLAKCTDELNIEIWWQPSFDAGVGIDHYDIYRNGTFVESVAHNPFTSTYHWVDTNPSTADNYNDNCYSVVPVDKFGNQNVSASELCFIDDTPPYPVQIDDVHIEYSEGDWWVVISWSDTAGGFGNAYRVEHAASESWLCMPELGLVEVAGTTYAHTMRLRRSSVMVGSPNRYFHIASIDLWGNESAYSEPYFFVDSTWAACTTVVHLYAGWNMISVPVMPRSSKLSDLFPSVLSPAYGYDCVSMSYVATDSLDFGYGYWVMSYYDHDVELVGYCAPEYSRILNDGGYYLIGSVGDVADFSTCPDVVPMNLIWWNPAAGTDGAYEYADDIEPGKGYWLIVLEPCTLNVPASGCAAREFSAEPKWTFDINAGGQKLYIGEGDDIFDIPMPAPPPNVQIPVIVGEDGKNYLRNVSRAGEWTIHLPSKMELQWNKEKIPVENLFLTGNGYNIDMREENSILLPAGEYRISANVVPAEFEAVARPNPFNSNTAISVIVPDDGKLSV